MPRTPDITLRIHVLSRTGTFLGGTVDVDIKNVTLSDRVVLRKVSAAEPIVIEGLVRFGASTYQVTVNTIEPFEVQAQFVMIPPSGEAKLEFKFDRRPADPPPPPPPGEGLRVSGRITRVDGTPVPDMIVRAFDHDLRSEE